MAAKKLKPLNIDTSKPEPTVEINKRIFDRLQWLFNRDQTVNEMNEFQALLYLILHTHAESEATHE